MTEPQKPCCANCAWWTQIEKDKELDTHKTRVGHCRVDPKTFADGLKTLSDNWTYPVMK